MEDWRGLDGVDFQDHPRRHFSPVRRPDEPKNQQQTNALEGREDHPIYERPHLELPITTARLLVQPFEPEDKHDVVRLLTNPSVMEFMGGVKDRAAAQTSFNAILERTRAVHYAPWALRDLNSNRLLGWCGIQVLKHLHHIELFYALFPENRRAGYATEASTALVDGAFAAGITDELAALVHPDNKPSVRVLTKLGFSLSKQIEDPATGSTADLYILKTPAP